MPSIRYTIVIPYQVYIAILFFLQVIKVLNKLLAKNFADVITKLNIHIDVTFAWFVHCAKF